MNRLNFSTLLTAIRDQDLDSNNDAMEFQHALLSCFEERFSTGTLEREISPNRISRLKRITRVEIFTNEKLVLATVLDPRLKLAPFLGIESFFLVSKAYWSFRELFYQRWSRMNFR